MYLKLLSDGFKFLEKGKNYTYTVITLCELLLRDKLTNFRGYWWFRLC
jgi:hypothetical protein